MKIRYFVLVALAIFASCKTIKPPAPTLPATPMAVEPLPPSVINVPVSVDLKSILADMETRIPATFDGEGNAGMGQYRWHIQRGPLMSDFTADSLNVSNLAQCTVGGYVKNPFNGNYNKLAGCDMNVKIGLKGQFTVLPNYTLQGNVRLAQLEMGSCDLFAHVNIIPLVRRRVVASVNDAVANLNRSINQYNIKTLIQPEWDALAKPMKINDVGYLLINPVAVNIGMPVPHQQILQIPVAITAEPVFSLNKLESTHIALPDMSGTTGNGFTVNLDARLHYKPLNKILAAHISQDPIATGPHSYFKIKSAEIFGEGNKHLLVKVNFSGKYGIVPYRGTMYFTCLPKFDPKTNNLNISEIDFDVHTANSLRGSWLLTPIVKRHVGREIHFNIASQLNQFKSELIKGLNRDMSANVKLSGGVSSFTLQDILPMDDYLLVRLVAKGDMAVNVH